MRGLAMPGVGRDEVKDSNPTETGSPARAGAVLGAESSGV